MLYHSPSTQYIPLYIRHTVPASAIPGYRYVQINRFMSGVSVHRLFFYVSEDRYLDLGGLLMYRLRHIISHHPLFILG